MSLGADMYRQQILDHYKYPRNYGTLDNPTFTHTGENPSCGDEYTFDIKLDDQENIVLAIAFRGEGCAISKSAASMLSEVIIGKTIDKIYEMDRDDILELLGVEITPMRIKCAVLAEKIIQDGLRVYQAK